MSEEKTLVWVPSSCAEKLKKAESEQEQENIIIKYIDESRKSVRDDLECLEEDVLQFRALMTKKKQAFREAKEEQIDQVYELWEEAQREIDKISKKGTALHGSLRNILSTISEINTELSRIQTWNFDRIIEFIERFNSLDAPLRDMVRKLFRRES